MKKFIFLMVGILAFTSTGIYACTKSNHHHYIITNKSDTGLIFGTFGNNPPSGVGTTARDNTIPTSTQAEGTTMTNIGQVDIDYCDSVDPSGNFQYGWQGPLYSKSQQDYCYITYNSVRNPNINPDAHGFGRVTCNVDKNDGNNHYITISGKHG